MTEFSPAPQAAALLIESFLDPAVSFDELARRANTSTESLCLWLSRPDIQERLARLDNTAALRTRMVADAQLPIAAKTLSLVLADFNAGKLAAEPELTPALRIRAALCAVRASNALFRLARFTPGPARPRPREDTKESPERELGSQLPLRASGGGGRVLEAGGGAPTAPAQIRVPLASSSGLASAIATAHSAPIDSPIHASLTSDPQTREADPRGEAARRSRDESPAPESQPAEIEAQLDAAGIPPGPDLPPEVLEAMFEALCSGDTTALPPDAAAAVTMLRDQLAPELVNTS